MPVDLADPIAVLLAATRAFDQAGLETAACGGLVVAMYGRARETKDADVAVSTADVGAACDALVALGLNVVTAFSEVVFGGSTVTRWSLGGELDTVDLVRPRSPRYAAAVMQRSLVGSLRGEPLRVVSAEDYVVFEILATRDRDLEDAQSVLDHQRGRLDEALIRSEVAALAIEIADHDVSGRFAKLVV